ncbi:MAG: FtsX-like permease family protein [Ruminococcaceae bacterium]|jgi:putative ABC transport system permease protein|nr:FtsX-like permease family protein [Oscillospiraceae bacterium]
MNVFHRFTRASLRENPSRTLVTIIGIMLSMALVTAVIQGAYSGIHFLVRSEETRVGAFHGYFYDLTEGEAIQARQLGFVKKSAVWQTVGWAEIGSLNEYKPYLLIRAVDKNFTDLVSVKLVSGRMPETPEELLLPTHLAANGDVRYKEGDRLTLAVGRRMMDGYELGEANPVDPMADGEEIADATERTYTVVGFYDRFDNLLEDYGCPGYTALTGWDGQGTGVQSVFFTVRNTGRFYDDMNGNPVSESWRTHDDLLRLSGSVRSANISTVIYGFAGVLIFLIAFGSISLIYNSFAISVSERTRQFGILKSVGATKKQIRGSVLYEALLLGGAGILAGAAVGCAGIGITLWALRDAFVAFAMGTGVQMKLVVSPAGMAVAAAVCLVTTLISAWIPAQRANRVSAIDAIRQTADVRVRARDVKVSSLTKKLFGFEGMMASKNFKRNRKRYRATVVSLFLSVTLFIAASSFCTYLTDTVKSVTAGESRVDIALSLPGDSGVSTADMLERLRGIAGVDQAACGETISSLVYFPSEALSKDYINAAESWRETAEHRTDLPQSAAVVFLDDESFRALCTENGLDPAPYMDAAAPAGLLYNRMVTTITMASGENIYVDVPVVREGALPLKAYLTTTLQIEGYTLVEVMDDGYYYYPEEYLKEVYSAATGEEKIVFDREKALVKTPEEAEIPTDLPVAATVKKTHFLLPEGLTAIFYPQSAKGAVTGDGELHFEQSYGVMAAEHARVTETIRQQLAADDISYTYLVDHADDAESMRMLVLVVRVFSYGFIILISLIAMANVFNTISTNVLLRRRELAMLKSIGLGEKGFRKMMNYECIIYGCKGLLWGLPASVALTYVIYRITGDLVVRSFYIPWASVVIAVGSVFAVVFATMLYATSMIRRDNPIDALKQENL